MASGERPPPGGVSSSSSGEPLGGRPRSASLRDGRPLGARGSRVESRDQLLDRFQKNGTGAGRKPDTFSRIARYWRYWPMGM